MASAIVICPFCSLLTLAHLVAIPAPVCRHLVLTPPVDSARLAVSLGR